MPIPININDLLARRPVESSRIEFKAGWNPDKVYHSICAFANDIDNLGGGYILVGVEEDNGVARRPVKGLDAGEIDRIQKDMLGYDAKISPAYMSRVSVEEVDGRQILAIWVPTGLNRPYCVAESVVARKSVAKWYVRDKSSSVAAKGEVLDELREMADRVPYADRGNPAISLSDISPILVYEYLRKIGSRMLNGFNAADIGSMLDMMDLRVGPSENRQVKNVAAMMFCETPDKFFPTTQVDIVIFPEGRVENPDLLIQVPRITGPVPKMISETLSYLRTNVIRELVKKPADRAESEKSYNYPYQAFEEAVVNALYHRDYREREPVEITIEPTHVDILSYAGPDRSISMHAIREARLLKARRYRNRRLGDFLKELSLTEGRATGIPTIQKVLRENGSPRATIETDEGRTYFLLSIPCRDGFGNTLQGLAQAGDKEKRLVQVLMQVLVQAERPVNVSVSQGNVIKLGQGLVQALKQTTRSDYQRLAKSGITELVQILIQAYSTSLASLPETAMVGTVSAILQTLSVAHEGEVSAKQLTECIAGLQLWNIKRRVLSPLCAAGFLAMTIPDKPTSPKQTYKLTKKGYGLFS